MRREKQAATHPQADGRVSVASIPCQDPDGRTELDTFLRGKKITSQLRLPVDEVIALTWQAVLGVYVGHAGRSDWPSYKAAATGFARRVERLYQAAASLNVDSSGDPVEMTATDWSRLTGLLRRIGAKIGDPPSGRPIPEFDEDFMVALELVRQRTNVATVRLELAKASMDTVSGRPRGSLPARMANQLRQLWERATEHKANVNGRTNDTPSGAFVEFCRLAPGLLPTNLRTPVTAAVAEHACRSIAKSPG